MTIACDGLPDIIQQFRQSKTEIGGNHIGIDRSELQGHFNTTKKRKQKVLSAWNIRVIDHSA